MLISQRLNFVKATNKNLVHIWFFNFRPQTIPEKKIIKLILTGSRPC